ncbi:MAG TPA: MBL fold metallo-hydrolase [Gemmataceae bacterium]|jgi:L-ascorbate metabolism protein UlaG (beta-lactamase superfamily)|nr:MBL fold metallo-hydrolase [Gemmataceae bacterium]
MTRFLPALVAGLLAANLATAADGKKVTIIWHGQSFFEIISSKGTRVVIDPHAIPAYPRTQVKADIVLESHLHNDHTQTEVVTNFKKDMLRQGLKDEKGDGKKIDFNPVDETFKDLHIYNVSTFHDDMGGMVRGRNTVFVIEVDGLRIAHMGDLGHLLNETQLKKIGAIDVLMIPVGGIYTLNGQDAKKVMDQIKPKQYVLPMHYNTKVYNDVLSEEEFLDEVKNKKDIKLYTTNELTVDAKFKPERPVIALLNFEKPEKLEK